MKIKMFLSQKERYEKFYMWHEWFAWHPVIIDGVFVWLETIERVRGAGWDNSFWSYRFINKLELLE